MTSSGSTDGPRNFSEQEFLEFTSHSILGSLSEDAARALLSAMEERTVPAGRRFISQGASGEEFFVIREGECFVTMRVGEIDRVVGRLGPGEVVGEMAILTGESRNANVDAETDMRLWAISRSAFDNVCQHYPAVLELLTRIVSNRLSKSLFMADRTIGKYTIERHLGTGGCSVVYRGNHSTLGIPVAVKMLKHHLAMQPDFVERFRNEAKVIARLNHENIVKVFDIEEMLRTFFIVMEFVEGEPLSATLRRTEKLTLIKALDYLLQVCRGLQHAHESGVVHSDVKPGNIIVQKGDRVRLIDFGFSAFVGSRDRFVGGTDLYVSPEQILRKPADVRSDIYALGLTAYEMLTGERACQGTDRFSKLNWHLESDIKDPRAVSPGLPEELAQFVIKAARRNPDLRYQSIRDVLSDLEPAAMRMGVHGGSSERQQLDMMGLFLVYRGEQHQTMQELVQAFSKELAKIGVKLWTTDIKNLLR